MTATPYPVFLRIDGRRVVLVGAGAVAASKLPALLEAGAAVVVIAPEVHADIAAAPVTIVRRCFEPQDLEDVWFVTAAATPAVNRQVRAAADARHLFVNAVDDPPSASAYLGGLVRRDGVTIAISTSGRAPALSGLLREGIDALLPANLRAWVEEAERVKQRQRATDVPMEARRLQLLSALNRLHPATGAPDERENWS